MSKAEEFYRQTNNLNNIVLSYAQKDDVLMLEAYLQHRVENVKYVGISNDVELFKKQLLKK